MKRTTKTMLALSLFGLIAASALFFYYKKQNCVELNEFVFKRRQALLKELLQDCMKYESLGYCLPAVEELKLRLKQFDDRVIKEEGCSNELG